MVINLHELDALIKKMGEDFKGKNHFRECLRHRTPRDTKTLEIGAGALAMFPVNEFPNAKILDYYSTEEITRHFIEDYQVNDAQQHTFPAIDFVCKDGHLRQAVGDTSFDMVYSSHAIEHQPCLLTHLNQVEMLLEPDGVAAFIIPDKTCTFDALRQTSTTGDVLATFHSKTIKPKGASLFDFYSKHITLNPGRKITSQDHFAFTNTLKFAYQKFVESLQEDAAYMDIHNWVFTPESFVTVLTELYMLGLIKLFPQIITPSAGNEFLCICSKEDTPPSENEMTFLNNFRLQIYKDTL